MSSVTCAQISDLHIPGENGDFRNVDTRRNFLRVLDDVARQEPDYLVLSGDLCATEGDPDIYRWVKEQVDAQEAPYFVMSGNHDDSGQLAEVFGVSNRLQQGELYYRDELGDTPAIFADTAPARMSDAQLDWFRNQLRDGVRLVFMHHPPIEAGVKYMDAHYPFRQMTRMRQIFADLEQSLSVFCGHYHAEQAVQEGNVTVFVTPSLAFQIHPEEQELVVDHRLPAWRKIVLEDGRILTSVRYLFDA